MISVHLSGTFSNVILLDAALPGLYHASYAGNGRSILIHNSWGAIPPRLKLTSSLGPRTHGRPGVYLRMAHRWPIFHWMSIDQYRTSRISKPHPNSTIGARRPIFHTALAAASILSNYSSAIQAPHWHGLSTRSYEIQVRFLILTTIFFWRST
ncbi:hypothetical protein LX32DRAFT_641451 [Colletotrichum zoysiae]|uniref:Uncharacterized protein n=1 Tax=Colletotrichum zoysiae TaxID=1216348 RepID=A0AAD9HF30_9PEZI|nr:hypothetical protein LX32DRAFT_641451 [Colletotrichum zoysiae]